MAMAQERGARHLTALWWRIAAVALAGVAVWTAGFLWFAGEVPREIADPATRTDAIVVLTGGSKRFAAGIELLRAGKGNHLFVSGVHEKTGVRDLLTHATIDRESITTRIATGHHASDTAGNARETASWMEAQGYQSLRLVTSDYHMPRSLLEFRAAMPGVLVVPHPVFPDRVSTRSWWTSAESASLLGREYMKFLVALAVHGLADLADAL